MYNISLRNLMNMIFTLILMQASINCSKIALVRQLSVCYCYEMTPYYAREKILKPLQFLPSTRAAIFFYTPTF